MDLAEISAHIEIQQVLYRYCRGVDRGDRAMIASVYHPDAEDRHGGWTGPGKAFGDYLVPDMDKTPLIGQHHITNTLIQVHGEEANVESYFIAFHPETGKKGARRAFVAGRYLDKFARRGDVWRIADREVVLDLATGMWDAPEWHALGWFPRGDRREDDPSANHFRVHGK